MKTVYASLSSDINGLQTKVMQFCVDWAREKKTPIPRVEVIKFMEKVGVSMPTTRNALYSLIAKGYIREAITISNKTSYVQLKSI